MVKDTKSEDQILFYIETRYCTVCNMDQPLRTKHCKQCEKCVATYDHHCPWVGNCIGERSRPFFYLFLLFQVVEVAWSFCILLNSGFESRPTQLEWLIDNFYPIVSTAVCGFFILMVGSLVVIHTYLA